MVQGNCTPNLDKKFAQLLFQRDRSHSCSLVSPFKISVCNTTYLQWKQHNFLLLRVDHKVSEEAIRQIWSRYSKDLTRYTQLVPSSLLFDTPRAMSYKASFTPNVVAPFTGGLLVVQSNCTPNLDKIFARLLFRQDHFRSCSLISLFKISYYNSNHAPPPFAVHAIK